MKSGGSKHLVKSLDKYLEHYLPRLRQCYDIIVASDPTTAQKPGSTSGDEKEWAREKIDQDRKALVDLLQIDADESLRIVLHGHLRGTLSDNKRLLHHARLYLTEQRHAVKLVELLFTYGRRPEAQENAGEDTVFTLAAKYSTKILADPDLWTGLINRIVRNFTNPVFFSSDDSDLNALFTTEVCIPQTNNMIFANLPSACFSKSTSLTY